MSSRISRVWLGIGGNIGNVVSAMANALVLLDKNSQIDVCNVSSIYKTPPWGVVDQPWFLNCCAEISTSHSPEDLLEICQMTERAGKRERILRWGPRTIDIDILVFENIEQNEQRLTLPHPRIKERAFVLVPLAEIAPQLMVAGEVVSDLVAQFDTGDITLEDHSQEWWRA